MKEWRPRGVLTYRPTHNARHVGKGEKLGLPIDHISPAKEFWRKPLPAHHDPEYGAKSLRVYARGTEYKGTPPANTSWGAL